MSSTPASCRTGSHLVAVALVPRCIEIEAHTCLLGEHVGDRGYPLRVGARFDSTHLQFEPRMDHLLGFILPPFSDRASAFWGHHRLLVEQLAGISG
jgi:hypothetical protein